MKKSIQRLIICCALLITLPLKAAPTLYLMPFKAVYAIKLHGLDAGTVTRTLVIDKNWYYHFTAITQSQIPALQISIFESSQGQWTPEGPQPRKYIYYYQIFTKKKNITTALDWQKHTAQTTKITNEYTRNYNVTFPDNVQDKLSYQLMLRLNLKYQTGHFSYPIVNKDVIDTYDFKIIDHETLGTPMGKIQTIKMQCTDAKQQENSITFWIAPKYHYALVKIVAIEDGIVAAEANLKSYEDM